MSGFDFGALRDLDAPQPDSRHRDGVEARARELRAKARRNRAIVSAVALVVVIAGVAGVIATRPDDDQVIVRNPSSTTTGTIAPTTHPSTDGRFVPPTTTENGITTLPVTLPNGETFSMKYPEQMKIAQLGFAGSANVRWPVENGPLVCCGKQVFISYQTVADVYGDATPVHVYRGRNGESVPYFKASQARERLVDPAYDYLVFQFGPWLVQVYDLPKGDHAEARMTDAQRQTWARSLTGTVDDNGYLVLHAAAPLSLTNQFDGGFGASGNRVELEAHSTCGSTFSGVPFADTSKHRRFTNEGGSGVVWCAGDLHVSAVGSKGFVDLADSSLGVSGPITTPPPASVVSATFVSEEQGWVMEPDGKLDTTVDGGRLWTAVGKLPQPAPQSRIRFADTSVGFAFNPFIDNSVYSTTNGGTTWTHLDTPFSRAYDLAISHGTVYAAALDGNAKFRIWSSPADKLSWTEDPLEIPVGGGPLPSLQLVFSDGAGWLVEVDRVVVAGARMSTSGHWSAWTPPCSTVNGPATLAAWSAGDLIAACDEGVWGSPPAPANAVYTSHDAGATFQRHPAPVYGHVAAADPNYALLVTGETIRRSVDGGRTWTEVAGRQTTTTGYTEPLDLGFTSNTQGFVILANDQMLMTYDAGATWSAVTKP